MAEFTRTPDASSEKYPLAVRTALLCAAMGDALGYPLELLSAKEIAARGPLTGENELIFSDDTQLSCYTLDALTEVLEWNNQGTPPTNWRACGWRICAGTGGWGSHPQRTHRFPSTAKSTRAHP